MNGLLVTLALGATMVWSQALGQDAGGSRNGAMQDVTRAQAERMAKLLFYSFDADGDGLVSRREAEQAGVRYGPWVKRMTDHVFGSSDSFTVQQFQSDSLAQFDRDDLNHDGLLSSAEREEARARLQEQRRQGQ